MKQYRSFLAGSVVGACASLLLYRKPQRIITPIQTTMTDTITVVDTLRIVPDPSPVRITKMETKMQSFPLADNPDSTATVTIERVQALYTDDSTYTAWVSGIEPCLDSIRVIHPVVTINHTTTSCREPSRWSVSISAGCAIGQHGITPYFGVGVSYTLVYF